MASAPTFHRTAQITVKKATYHFKYLSQFSPPGEIQYDLYAKLLIAKAKPT